jgi:hypothetical protein
MSLEPTWRKGVPLLDAARRLASRRERTSAQLPPLSLPQGADEHAQNALAALQNLTGEWLTQSKAIAAGQDRLLARLQNGMAVAIGYAEGEHPSEAVIIEKLMFQREFVDWSRSRLIGAGRKYHLVRIVSPDRLPERFNPERPSLPTKRGRPSAREQIRAAAAALGREGVDLSSLDNQTMVKLVVRKVQQLYPAMFKTQKGLSYNSVCRALGRF